MKSQNKKLKTLTTEDIIKLSKDEKGKINIQEALILFLENKKMVKNKKLK